MSESRDKTPDNSNAYSCVACQRPDSADNIVACDKCSDWWHYSCAGVTDSVKTAKWLCRNCFPQAAQSVSNASTSASRKARLELSMKRLEEQRELDKKLMELELEKKYLKQKYQLLEETLQEEFETRSVRSRVNEIESRQNNVRRWVEQQASEKSAAKEDDVPAVTSDNRQDVHQGPPVHITDAEDGAVGGVDCAIRDPQAVPGSNAFGNLRRTLQNCKQDQPTLQQLQELQEQLKICQLQLQQQSTPISSRRPDVSKGAIRKTHRDEIVRPAEDMPRSAVPNPMVHEAHDQHRNHRYPEPLRNPNQFAPSVPLVRHRVEVPIPSVSSFVPRGPSPEQIAARQVMTRDLPEFTGDPEEWPMFESSFNNTTAACGYNHAENLSRLQRCLKGAALKSVRYYLMSPESVPDVMKTLKMLYGRPEMIVNKLIRNVRETPSPKPEKLETLIEFGMAIRNLTQHLIAAGQQSHLSNPILLQELVDKLPAGVKLQWAQHLQNHPVASLQILSQFMTTVVDSVSKVVVYVGEPIQKHEKSKIREKGFLHAHAEANGAGAYAATKRCPICTKDDHRVPDCTSFKRISVENRWKSVTSLKLCRCCLNFHGRRTCKSTNRCGVNGCELRHHPLLHSPPPTSTTTGNQRVTQSSENHAHHHCGQSVLFRIIPVVLHGPSKSMTVFAFLDEGSSATLIEHDLIGQLGIEGQNAPLCLTWTANMSRLESKSQLVSLDISGIGQQKRYQLANVRSVKVLNLPRQTLRFGDCKKAFDTWLNFQLIVMRMLYHKFWLDSET